jgi:hypothetical protein
MKTTNHTSAIARLALGVGVGTIALAWAAPAAFADPPGNNGTVKVDGVAFDSHPDNEPHVGCSFEIDWYGFDKGDFWSDVTFEVQPPTGKPAELLTDSVFIGEDDNSGGGSEAGLDASKEYDLTDALVGHYTPQPQQGYHVKLTLNTDGSQGADVKHKVFWVDGCEGEEPPPTTTPPTTEPPTTEPPATTTPPGDGGGGGITTSDTPEAEVLGESIERDPALPRTGIDSGLWSLVGTSLLTSGGVMTALSRKVRRES